MRFPQSPKKADVLDPQHEALPILRQHRKSLPKKGWFANSRDQEHNIALKASTERVFDSLVLDPFDETQTSTKMAVMSPIQLVPCCFVAAILLAVKCHSWNIHSHNKRNFHCRANPIRNHIQNAVSIPTLESKIHCRPHNKEEDRSGITRRGWIFNSLVAATLPLGLVPKAEASLVPAAANQKGVVTVRLESPSESLGIEIYDTALRGRNVVAIRRIVVPNPANRLLQEGMILQPRSSGSPKGYTCKEFRDRLRSGPYPLAFDFVNLAAGGDAISDMGTSIVTPKDALELAQRTEGAGSSTKQSQQYSITTLRETSQTCAIRSRRNDVLEIEYDAYYLTESEGVNRKVVYDASDFRGTGNRPYQMVLGSGDMIPGVDQGLYDMCPGDKRLLTIPPALGHGPNGRKLYKIPDNYQNLEWEVSLVTIDSTVKEDNNNVSRDEREARFAY